MKPVMRLLGSLLLSFFYFSSAQLSAAEWSDESHTVFSGDFNGDGLEDIYLQGIPKFVSVTRQTFIPLLLPSDYEDLVLELQADGTYVLIYSPDKSLTEAVAWVEAKHLIHLGDFNGDGLADYFLQGTLSGESSIVLLASASGIPAINEVISSNDVTADNATITVADVNNDGRDDLLIDQVGFSQKIAYANTFGEFPDITSGPDTTDTFVAVTKGQASVDGFGGASYRIPIEIPAGIEGMQPSLSLQYSSRNGPGTLGMGWGMAGLSAISRCAPTLDQDGYNYALPYTADERFCLNGQKLVKINDADTYGADGTEYRTEVDQFSKIISYGTAGSGPAYFKVWERTGRIVEYGNTDDSRIEAQGKTEAATWSVNRVEDRFANYYTVSYDEDTVNGEYTPSRIDYSGNDTAGVAASMSVRFSYVDRPINTNEVRGDVIWGYRGGSLYRNSQLLDKVETYIDETPVREYAFQYLANDVTGHSRLDALTECGYDEAGSQKSCALPSQLAWQSGEVGFDDPVATSLGATHGTAQQPFLIDTDGDGYQDLVWSENATWHVAYGAAAGFGATVDTGEILGAQDGYAGMAMPIRLDDSKRYGLVVGHVDGYGILTWYITTIEPVWTDNLVAGLFNTLGHKPIVGDFNSDARDDVLLTIEMTTENPNYSALLFVRNELPWAEGEESLYYAFNENDLHSGTDGEIDLFGALILDFDGDGLLDILAKKYDGTKGRYLLSNAYLGDYLGTAVNGFTRSDAQLPFGDGEYGNGIAMDVNGDQLADFVVRVSNTWRIYVNEGGTFGAEIDTGVDSGGQAERALPVDYDGDGVLDLLVEHPTDGSWRILLSTQEQLPDGTTQPNFVIRDTGYASKGYADGIVFNDGLTSRKPEDETPIVADYNGDGLTDLLYHDSGLWYVLQHKTEKADLLASVTDGFGNTDEFTYKPLTDTAVYTLHQDAAFPVQDTRAAMQVVSEHKTSNGIGGLNSSTYTYEGAKIHLRGRGLLGFAQRSVTDGQTGNTSTTTNLQSFPYTSRPDTITVTQSDGKVLRTVDNTWASHALHNGKTQFPYIESTITQQYDLATGTAYAADKVENTYSTNGSLTDQVKTTGSGVASNAITGVERTVTMVNAVTNDLVNWLLGFVDQQAVTYSVPNTPDKTVSTAYTPEVGTLEWKTKTDFQGSGVEAVTTRSFDAVGHITAVDLAGDNIVARTAATNNNYLSNRYPQQVLNAKGHATDYTYDLRFGEVLTATDLNGLVSSASYDALGRQKQVVDADGTVTDVYFAYLDDSYPDHWSYKITTTVTHPNLPGQYARPVTVVYYDTLGRELRTETQGFNGKSIYVDTSYDNLGRVDTVSEPYFSGDVAVYTDYDYDILGRTTEVLSPDGGIVTTQYGLSVSYATEASKTTRVVKPDSSYTDQTTTQSFNTLG